jgi:hypothetical protein
MPINSISRWTNTLYMSHIKGGSGLRWLSASTMNDSDDDIDIDSSDSDDGEESVLDYGTDSSDSD